MNPSEGSAKHSKNATKSTSPASISHSVHDTERRRRRQQLQEQCLLPSGLAASSPAESRTEAWLYLLDISQDNVARRAAQLSKGAVERNSNAASPVSDIVKDSLSSSIPLDKDGWQVADQDLLSASSSTAATAVDHDGWKVVKSKRSRKHLTIESATAPQPDSPQPSHSMNTSTLVSEATTSAGSSPAMSTSSRRSSDVHDKDAPNPTDGSAKTDSTTPINQQKFPILSIRDIEQVAKDVERSFIGPAFQHLFSNKAHDEDSDMPSISPEKALRRKQLTHLVLTTLSAHPSLNYFQGYHDILSIVLLTCASPPPDPHSDLLFTDSTQQATVELVAERISLHVIRDSMTPDLLPVMGQLKILANLIQLSDSSVAELVERASPMPFFALPWLLTLLTHDAKEVEVMQSVLEFVLAYGLAAAIYLCATVPIVRKDEILAMDEDELEDPAMLHTILSKLPNITAEDEQEQSGKKEKVEEEAMYTDPDVELPSLASDRALAEPKQPQPKPKGIPISTLLHKAVQLMDTHPLTSPTLQADKIMGASSVLFTWTALFSSSDASSIDWNAQNLSAEAILAGPIDAIVIDPHPPAPASDEGYYDDEKHSFTEKSSDKNSRRNSMRVASTQTQMLALVGISGLLVAALFTAATGGAQKGTAAGMPTADETKRVVALVVSLLSNWGRVVAGGTS